MNTKEHYRYKRHTSLPQIGKEGQLKFRAAKVLVIGAGGLGCPVLQYLTAAGVGQLGIVDFDVVDESNLQRQILYTTADIGKSKAFCSASRLHQLNPFIEFKAIDEMLTETNALDLLSKYDLVVDGSDNFRTRYLVNDACVILKKPLVFGSIYQFEGQVTVFNYLDGPTYRCLYPEPNNLGSCEEAGVLGVLPGTIGCLMATEVLKIISGVGDVLSGKLLLYDALKSSFQTFVFNTVEENKLLKEILPFVEVCEAVPEITAQELKKKLTSCSPIKLIDVREEAEYSIKNLGGELIPLGTLLNNLKRIPRNIPVVVHCKSGARSRKAVQLLLEKGYRNVTNLMGGIDGYV